jgi:hypothetical protein
MSVSARTSRRRKSAGKTYTNSRVHAWPFWFVAVMGITAKLNASCYAAVRAWGSASSTTTRVALRSGAPPMSTTDQIFGDSDAPTIDKAIASSVVAQYVGSQLRTLTGHFQSLEPNQYSALYKRWGGSKYPFKEVPGYTDRGDNERPIKLMAPGTYNGEYLKGATF